MVLAGENPTPEGAELFKGLVREEMGKKGNKHFIEILKGEFKGVSLGVKVSVAGKSKNLATQADKLSSGMRFVLSTYNPQTGTFPALDDPRIAKMINSIWEASGLQPIDFSVKGGPPIQSPIQAPQLTNAS